MPITVYFCQQVQLNQLKFNQNQIYQNNENEQAANL